MLFVVGSVIVSPSRRFVPFRRFATVSANIARWLAVKGGLSRSWDSTKQSASAPSWGFVGLREGGGWRDRSGLRSGRCRGRCGSGAWWKGLARSIDGSEPFNSGAGASWVPRAVPWVAVVSEGGG